MKLNKRSCPINIELCPYGVDMLDISMDICGKHYDFSASSVMGEQFGAFLYALYAMYHEDTLESRFYRNSRITVEHSGNYVCTHFWWDSEGGLSIFDLKRLFDGNELPDYNGEDNIEITINKCDAYVVDARDLCYAVAKASTDAMKKYGIYGYHLSCGANCNGFGDSIDFERLLFVKAYALNAMEVRKTTDIRDNMYEVNASSFEQELELLLFDM